MKAVICEVKELSKFSGYRFSVKVVADDGKPLLIIRGFRMTKTPRELLPVLAYTPKGNAMPVASVLPAGQSEVLIAMGAAVREGGETEVWG